MFSRKKSKLTHLKPKLAVVHRTFCKRIFSYAIKYNQIEKTMVESRAIAVKNTDSEVKLSSTERSFNGNLMECNTIKSAYYKWAPKRDEHIRFDICHTIILSRNFSNKKKISRPFFDIFQIFLIIILQIKLTLLLEKYLYSFFT